MRLYTHCALLQVVKRHGFLYVAGLGHLHLHRVDVALRLAIVTREVTTLELVVEYGAVVAGGVADVQHAIGQRWVAAGAVGAA